MKKFKLVVLLSSVSLLILAYFMFLKNKSEIIENTILQHNDSLLSSSYYYLMDNAHFSQKDFYKNTNKGYTLFDDINFSLRQCRDELNANSLPFNIFCEYILPPIIDQEPFENWKQTCYNEFSFIESLSDDIFLVCDTINKYIGKHFTFKNRGDEFKQNNWSRYQKDMSGNCFDMTKIVLYPLRSLGYATTVDYILGWGNADGSHSWNVIYDINKKRMIPFMGLQESTTYNPFILYDYKTDSSRNGYRYPAKIFRKTFSVNQKYKKMKELFSPRKNTFFRDLNFIDVTSEYFSVADIVLIMENKYVEEVLFLCVYNSNMWVPVSVNFCDEDNRVKFEEMNKELLYILSDGINTVSYPFILLANSEIKILKPSIHNHIEITVNFLKSREEEYAQAWSNLSNLPRDVFEGIASDNYRVKPINGEKYQIFIYNQGWQFTSESIARNNKVIFSQIPKNGLYIIKCQDKIVGRPFTYDDYECNWW